MAAHENGSISDSTPFHSPHPLPPIITPYFQPKTNVSIQIQRTRPKNKPVWSAFWFPFWLRFVVQWTGSYSLLRTCYASEGSGIAGRTLAVPVRAGIHFVPNPIHHPMHRSHDSYSDSTSVASEPAVSVCLIPPFFPFCFRCLCKILYGWTGPRWKGAFRLVPWAVRILLYGLCIYLFQKRLLQWCMFHRPQCIMLAKFMTTLF